MNQIRSKQMLETDMAADDSVILRDLAAIERRVAETEERIKRHSEALENLNARGLACEFQTMIVRENEILLALQLNLHAKLLEQLSRT
jgi:hypothetical protein